MTARYTTPIRQPEVVHKLRTPGEPGTYCGRGMRRWVLLAEAPNGLRPCRECDGLAFGMMVYRCFDDAGRLLYVGSTVNIVGRLIYHSTQSKWWPAARVELEGPYSDEFSLRLAERSAIDAENPLHNSTPLEGRRIAESARAAWEQVSA